MPRAGIARGFFWCARVQCIWRRLVCFSHCAEYFIALRAALFYRFGEYEIGSENLPEAVSLACKVFHQWFMTTYMLK